MLFIGENQAIMIMTYGGFSVFESAGVERNTLQTLKWHPKDLFVLPKHIEQMVFQGEKNDLGILCWDGTGGLHRTEGGSWCLAKSMWYTMCWERKEGKR